MPIISRCGSRSPKTRLVYLLVFMILSLGAVTMIYPLLLMVAGSFKSDTDFAWISPLPQYWFDDDVLWMKFIEQKYGNIAGVETAYHRAIGSWRKLRPPAMTDQKLSEDFISFRENQHWPDYWFALGFSQAGGSEGKHARAFRKRLQERFNDDIGQLSLELGCRYESWAQVGPPSLPFAKRRFTFPKVVHFDVFYDLKRSAPKSDWVTIDLDGDFWRTYLLPEWPRIEAYNAAHGTAYGKYDELLLAARPPQNPAERRDWETYVRQYLNAAFVRIAPSASGHWQAFLRQLYAADVNKLNQAWSTEIKIANFEAVELPPPVPKSQRQHNDLLAFLKNPQACPLDSLSVYGPRQAFEEYLSKQGRAVTQPVRLPSEQVDYIDFQKQTGSLRWEFTKRNYVTVIDYLLLHGNGLRNTVIFCTLAIATTLLVNPLAAYALSRYRPPSAYMILLFCMATMAFPAEVTMIPSFLLLKRFPLLPLVIAVAGAVAAICFLHKLRPRWPAALTGSVGVGIGILAGYWLTPHLSSALLGRPNPNISLLNTFWALVLPGMANGFSIFLLKGFFDSLPRELYEAADLDGAGEWTKFWMISMSLSKPILAVLALGAFIGAYSEFMMALVIIPDQRMWTMMVWLFQLQQRVHPTIVYASLVVAAIPTFLVFVFCQNLIMRGIVVPVER